MKLCSIASGSSGNCSLLVHNNTNVLVDIGISKKALEEELGLLGISPDTISAIFITHEHVDHIKGLGTFLRKYKKPVFATAGTIEKVLAYKYLGKVDESLFHPILSEKKYKFKDLDILPIKTFHDAAEPVGYRFSDSDHSLAVITDLGKYTEDIVNELMCVEGVIIEANHDVRMLEAGIYPYYLKKRILSSHGHLSNDDCSKLINTLVSHNLKAVILGHLSKENNLPRIAYETIKQGLLKTNNDFCLPDIYVASPTGHSEWIIV